MTFRTIQLIFVFLACMASLARAQDKPAEAPTLVVIASGTGLDEKAALKQALSNAVTQAVGTIVDAETVVKDDRIIRDQILTASNAVVSKYEPIGPPTTEAGLVTVRIKATVERRALTERLEAASVVARPVEGRDLFAQGVTELQKETDSAKIVRRVFDGFPGNVLKAEPDGKPAVISKTASSAVVGVRVKFYVDMEKYGRWQSAFIPILSKVAIRTQSVRWNPKDSHAGRLDVADESWRPKGNLGVSVPDEELAHSYVLRDILAFGEDSSIPQPKEHSALAVMEKRDSTKVRVLELDDATFAEVIAAAWAVPVVEVTLKDTDGRELDGQTHDAAFEIDRSTHGIINANCFWAIYASADGYGLRPGRDCFPLRKGLFYGVNTTQWKTPLMLAVIPYAATDHAVAVSAFVKEFRFELPLDELKKLGLVECRISSRNDGPEKGPP